MSEMTYATLLSDLSSYMERPSVADDAFLAQRPSFIALAESVIAAEFKQQGFQTVVTGSLPLAESLEKPTLWRDTISLRGKLANGTWFPIFQRNYEFVRACYPDATPGQPRYYADYNATNFLLGPRPDAEYEFELVYYAKLDPLGDSNQTNWMTLNVPQLLLAAALEQAATWCGDAAKLGAWSARYQRDRDALLGENMGRLGDRAQRVPK